MAKTTIEWATDVWNPVRGCTKVSHGCDNCYAMGQAHRFSGKGQPYEGLTRTINGRPQWIGKVRCVPEALDQPLRWTKPRRIFVNSMSDLFHEDVPFQFIDDVFGVMADCHTFGRGHVFQILTKRPERAIEYFTSVNAEETRIRAVDVSLAHGSNEVPWPLPNVWLGVSVEDQETADARIPLLLQTPAAVRFLSCEPLLRPIRLREQWLMDGPYFAGMEAAGATDPQPINWIIVGGESGPKARPFSVDAGAAIVRQCAAANVPCFVKQIGRYPYSEAERWSIRGGGVVVSVGDEWTFRDELRDRKGGDPAEWPEYLRVREYPT